MKRSSGGTRLAGVVVALVLSAALAVAAASAQGTPGTKPKPPAPSTSQRLAQQQRKIDAQQAAIDTLRALIARQTAAARAAEDSAAARLAAQRERLEELEARLTEAKTRLEALESQSSFPAWEDSLEKRLAQVEASTQKSPELPPDVVSAGDFPGSIRVPGSDAAVKFGGRIRTAAVFTLDPLGTDDRFLTNSIPVGSSGVSGEAKRTNISSRASRLNTEFRTPGGSEEIRAFFEGDFAGESNAFRLRHAYAQYRGFIAGQTWSTYSDPLVDVEDLDFEGISSENVTRQAQLRYWWSPKERTRLAVAMETPAVSITGGTGVNLFPDVIARGFWGRANGGHTQVAGVLRQIRGETAPGVVGSDWGAGGTVSGIVLVPVKNLKDRILYQVNGGRGIARYVNDLSSAGGMDAVVDTASGDLKALPAFGWYVAYEHKWVEWEQFRGMNMRSTILWSYVGVGNFDFQPPDAYRKTNRLATNVVFSPNGRVDLGLEYIFGSRENKDGQQGHANQFQLVALFRF
jgi:hypothetical protein